MPTYTRREFLHNASYVSAAMLLGSAFTVAKQPLLSFSTIGCPDWDFTSIVQFAAKHQFNGIEVRGIQRQLDLSKCKEFENYAARKKSLQQMKDAGLAFVGLGSSCTLHFAEGAEREKNLDEGKRFIDIAIDIDCPCVRVFPNLFPKDQSKLQTMELISKGLLQLAAHAKGTGVKVLLESHGDLVYTNDLLQLMQASAHTNIGLIWDVCNMWSVTREDPDFVYKQLSPFIYHTHIKDAHIVDGKPQYVLLGKGEVPVLKAIELLSKNNYKGYYSFEWEKLWHPQLEGPEVAFVDFINTIQKHFN